jgi:hypothetical protein
VMPMDSCAGSECVPDCFCRGRRRRRLFSCEIISYPVYTIASSCPLAKANDRFKQTSQRTQPLRRRRRISFFFFIVLTAWGDSLTRYLSSPTSSHHKNFFNLMMPLQVNLGERKTPSEPTLQYAYVHRLTPTLLQFTGRTP